MKTIKKLTSGTSVAFLAVILVFVSHAKAQTVVLVEYLFNTDGVVTDTSGNDKHGILIGAATVTGGKLHLTGVATDYVIIPYIDTMDDFFDKTPFDGLRDFRISMDLKTSTGGFVFASDNTNFVGNEPSPTTDGAFSFYVNTEDGRSSPGGMTRDNWFISADGGGPDLRDDVEHHIVIDYVADVDADTATLRFEIDGGSVFPSTVAPSLVAHDTSHDDMILGANITLDSGFGAEFGYLTGTIDNFRIEFDLAPLFEQLIDDVEAADLPNGIENSIIAKIRAARRTLGDLNGNNDGAACGNLNAIIKQVEAIEPVDAVILISKLEEIKAAIGCQ